MENLETLDAKEVAGILKLGVRKVRSLLRTGAIPAKNVSEGKARPTYRVFREQLERWLAGEKVKR